MSTMAGGHEPVMLDRVLALLAPALTPPGAILVDATLGRAGHARALLDAHPRLRLIGLDTDPQAIGESARVLAGYPGRVTLEHAVYDQITAVLARHDVDRVQGVLFDLGVSSPQLDQRDRGFAYSYDAVVRERAREPLSSTARLSEIVRDAIPAPARRTGGHPAKRTFQALRIEVNGELAALGRALPLAVDVLAVGGRIVVLAYHSLEDRAVKRALASRSHDTTPRGLPVPLAGAGPELRLLSSRAERPDAAETAANPRATPARLRAAERIREAA